MMIDIGMICGGLLLLYYGGEGLVNGSVAISQRLGVSAVLIGMVVVGFGTSTPELLVSIKASLASQPDIALGNVVGSNIANILLILGFSSLITPILCKNPAILRDAFVVVLASLVLYGLTFAGHIVALYGFLMLALLIAYLAFCYIREQQLAKKLLQSGLLKAEDRPEPEMGLAKALIFAIGGIALLVFGANFLVEGASNVARSFGVSEAVIGLSLVAVGTSLPELAAALAASLKKQSDIVIGNILGSNLFNILCILGITAMIKPIPLQGQIAEFDIPLSLGISSFTFVIIFLTKRIGRVVGLLFLLCYVAYISSLYLSGA